LVLNDVNLTLGNFEIPQIQDDVMRLEWKKCVNKQKMSGSVWFNFTF